MYDVSGIMINLCRIHETDADGRRQLCYLEVCPLKCRFIDELSFLRRSATLLDNLRKDADCYIKWRQHGLD